MNVKDAKRFLTKYILKIDLVKLYVSNTNMVTYRTCPSRIDPVMDDKNACQYSPKNEYPPSPLYFP